MLERAIEPEVKLVDDFNYTLEDMKQVIINEMEEYGLCEVIEGVTATPSDMRELENNIAQLIKGNLKENDLIDDMARRAERFEHYRELAEKVNG